ncbi:hypothetical protein N5C12_09855 [Comamonas aquatica]|uniref:hypothetical protein n=1 Tax=Comamonas aquatica TaxID=225991 RepID=UPI00244CF604|nr:hypothetical protein [Comamonas aquatica]MDH0899655.1 hypothetical protein [Comamonas aquatica]
MSLTFVNVFGEQITAARMAEMRHIGAEQERRKRAAIKADSAMAHKGWRVTGIPPGALEDAMASHQRVLELAAKAGGKPIEPFCRDTWLRKQRRVAVRSKPYSIEQAANDCRDLAIKSGWIEVRVTEIKKGGQA